MRRRTALLIPGLVPLVLLSGCALLPLAPGSSENGGRGPEEVDVVVLKVSDLTDVLGQDDSPDGSPFYAIEYRATFDEMTEYMKSGWTDGGGDPQECYDTWALATLVTPDDDGPSRAFFGIGQFEYEYETQGLIVSAGRIFDDEKSALRFIDFVSEASLACPAGYQLAGNGDGYRVDEIIVSSPDLDLPPGVTVIHHDESPPSSFGHSYRDSFVQYANAVVGLSCEVHAGSPFDYGDCDALVEIIASRMVE